MRKLLIALAMFGASQGLQAQPTFMKLLNNATGAGRLSIIELPSGRMMMSIATSKGVSLLDAHGSIITAPHFLSDDVIGPISLYPFSSGKVGFAAIRLDQCANGQIGSQPAIGLMDTLGNVMSIRCYPLVSGGCDNTPIEMIETADGGTVMWGWQRNFYMLKVDASGDVQWARVFGYPNGFMSTVGHNGGFQFVKELPGGDLLAGFSLHEAGAAVARLDGNGSFIWCRSYIRPSALVHDCVIESEDSFIVLGATDSIASTNTLIPLPPNYQPKLFMMKLNGGGEVQWCRGYDCAPNRWYSRSASRIERTQDGNYIILSNIGQANYNLEYRPLLMKVDLNGDTLWTRSFGMSGARYTIGDLLAYSDGGFIFNGLAYGNVGLTGVSSAFYLYKTDSLGLLPCHNQHHPISISELFPVDSAMTLTSSDGATMLEESFTDSTYAPTTVYDGCTFTTGMPSIQERRPPMRIRPNPTTGRFILEVPDPLIAESYYSVYDALGKLLYQRPLPAGATVEEVDLSRFGRGTYVVKLTDPEGVRWERVVLE